MNMKGGTCTVEPIKSLAAVAEIKEMLAGNPRDFGLFVFGINAAFRASDLIALTVGKLRHIRPGQEVLVKEKKTGKNRAVTVNKSAWEAIQPLLDAPDSAPLFRSLTTGESLRVETVHRLVKEWCRKAGLKGNYGSHTLRKTFGHLQHTINGVSIETLMETYGHTSTSATRRYICIQPEAVRDVYLNEL